MVLAYECVFVCLPSLRLSGCFFGEEMVLTLVCVCMCACIMESSSPLALKGGSRPQGFSPIKGPFSGKGHSSPRSPPPPTHLSPFGLKETGLLYQDLISRGKSILQNIFNQSDQPITDSRDQAFGKKGNMI